MNQYSGVIPQAIYAASNPIRRMVMEILNGHKEPYTEKEIGDIVDERYFGFVPLANLTQNEALFLRDGIVKRTQSRLNGGCLREFLEATCYKEGPPDDPNSIKIYSSEYLKEERRDVSKLSRMADAEKLEFLDNPKNLHAYWYVPGHGRPFAGMGYRSFENYSMSDQIAKILKRLQDAKGRKDLRVMDLGGGVGRALNDLKKMHPELITHNATRDEEFSHYPADFHVIGFMERMPIDLKGKIDLIFSNMATRYFAYTDLVIEGCVSMLSQGGIMKVFFSSERSNNDSRDDVRRRMKKAHDFLMDLKLSSAIKLGIKSTFSSNFGGKFKSEKGSLFPSATVFVQKL